MRKSAFILIAALVSGCSGKATLGEAISNQGRDIAAIGELWTEGNELVEEGRDQIERGEDMIERGRDLIEEGEDNIERGKRLKADAEMAYTERTGQKLPVPE